MSTNATWKTVAISRVGTVRTHECLHANRTGAHNQVALLRRLFNAEPEGAEVHDRVDMFAYNEHFAKWELVKVIRFARLVSADRQQEVADKIAALKAEYDDVFAAGLYGHAQVVRDAIESLQTGE